MKTILLTLTCLSALVGSACANITTPFRAPADVRHIQLERGDSPTLVVEKIWLERKGGPLLVRGYVLKRLYGGETDHTVLEVTLLDSSGTILRRVAAKFEPRHLVRQIAHPPVGSYQVELGELPDGTARIRVQAKDEAH